MAFPDTMSVNARGTETQNQIPQDTSLGESHGAKLRPRSLCEVRAAMRDLHRLLSGYSSVVPPDPIPNSEVKRARADGSVA